MEDNLKAIIKPQYVDHIPKAVKGVVGEIMANKNEKKNADSVILDLDLTDVQTRQVADLSGGELQRFAIAVSVIQKADVYMFDEPSSYLDVKQRLNAARSIRTLLEPTSYVIVVEHDLSVLDYLSDFICVLYGVPGAYGVVTMPFSVREGTISLLPMLLSFSCLLQWFVCFCCSLGINIFLEGTIPTENLRFREDSLTFRMVEKADEEITKKNHRYTYPGMSKALGDFSLEIKPGDFTDSEILVMLGQNGTGKTTFIRMLAGLLKADTQEQVPELNVSYKPQKISPKFDGTVRQLFLSKIRDMINHPQFQTDVVRPLQVERLMDQEVQHLSGGELQRVALILCLGKPVRIFSLRLLIFIVLLVFDTHPFFFSELPSPTFI